MKPVYLCFKMRSLVLMGLLLFPLLSHAILVGTTDTPSRSKISTTRALPPPVNVQKVTTTNVKSAAEVGLPDNLQTGTAEKTIRTGSKKVIVIEDPVPITPEDINEIMIETSNDLYKGRCPCPYSPDPDGFECGLESLYHRPGGHRIYCYPQDIRGQQEIFYRKTPP